MSTFPTSHTTTTAATTTATSRTRSIFINKAYVRSKHGILKVATMVLGLLMFICVMAAPGGLPHLGGSNYISFVSWSAFWISGVLLFLYIINVVSFLEMIPWVIVEFFYCALWTLFCFISGIVASSLSGKYVDRGAMAVAAFFSFVNMLVFAYYAVVLYRLYRDGVRLVLVMEVTEPTTNSTNPS